MINKSNSRLDPIGTLATLVTLVFWAIAPNFARWLADYTDAWTQNFWRFLTSMLFWLPFLLVMHRRGKIESRVWRLALAPGLICIVMQSLCVISLYYIAPAFNNFLARSSIVFIAFFSMILFPDERGLLRSGRFWLGMTLCSVGLLGVAVFHGDLGGATLWGIILTILFGLSWAIYTLVVRKAFLHLDQRVGFAVITIYATPGLGVLAWLYGKPLALFQFPAPTQLRVWAVIIISAILCIAIAHTIFFVAIRRLGPTLPSLTHLSLPFLVLLVSQYLFGEKLTLGQWLSGIVLVAGAALSILAQHARHPAITSPDPPLRHTSASTEPQSQA